MKPESAGLFEHDYRAMVAIAARLYGMCTADYPAAWRSIVAPQILSDATQLVLPTRRVLRGLALIAGINAPSFKVIQAREELPHLSAIPIDGTERSVEEVRELDHCLNQIAHMEEFSVCWVPSSEQNERNGVASAKIILTRTDQRPQNAEHAYVPIARVCLTILTDVARTVKQHAKWAAIDWAKISPEMAEKAIDFIDNELRRSIDS